MTKNNPHPDGVWYVTDKSLEKKEGDKFAASDIAAQLEDIVTAITPPATIGLIGGFGVGKTSITNMLQERLKGHSEFQVVSLSADRHTGVEKQRAILFGFAEALVTDAGIEKSSVSAALERVDHDVVISGAELDNLPVRVLYNKIKHRLPGLLFRGAGAVAMAYLVGALIAGIVAGLDWTKGSVWQWPARWVLPTATSIALVLGIGSLLPTWFKTAFTPNSVERRRNRAQAADELERVFAELADLCKKTLVVVVDDIDRLSSSDVLEALASVKTFQAIPKRRIIFILSCDDRTIRQALVDASPGLSKVNGDLGIAAEEYLNKLFVVRQVLPPFRATDLRDYASALLEDGHAGKAALGGALDDVLDILLHDGVRNPRHVIRLINAFFSNYRLAAMREQGADLPRGEVTGQPKLLARLTTLQVDFADIFDVIAAEFSVLPLLDLLVLEEELNAEQLEVLRSALNVEEPGASADDLRAGLEPALQDYLLRTVRSVPDVYSLEPFIYFGQTSAGKILGSERADQIRQSLANRQPKPLLDRFTEGGDVADAAVDHALESLKRARRGLAQTNTVAALTEALSAAPVARQRNLADEITTVISAEPQTAPPPRELATLLAAADPKYAPTLTRHLVDFTVEANSADKRAERAGVLAEVALERPSRTEVVRALSEYFETLPEHAGWDAAEHWLDVFDGAPVEQRRLVVDESFFTAVAALSVGAAEPAISAKAAVIERLYADPQASSSTVADELQACLRAEGAGPRAFALAALRHHALPAESAAGTVEALAESFTDDVVPVGERAESTIKMIEQICAAHPAALTNEDEAGAAAMAALVAGATSVPVAAAKAYGPVVAAFSVDSAAVAASLAAAVQERRSMSDAIGVMMRDALLSSLVHVPAADGTTVMNALLSGINVSGSPESAEAQFGLDTLDEFLDGALPGTLLDPETVRWHTELTTTAPVAGYSSVARALGSAGQSGLVTSVQTQAILDRMISLNANSPAYRPIDVEALTWITWPAEQQLAASAEIGANFDLLPPEVQIGALERVSGWADVEESSIAGTLQEAFLAMLTSDDADERTLALALPASATLAGAGRATLVARLLESQPSIAAAAGTLDTPAAVNLLVECAEAPTFRTALASLSSSVQSESAARFVRVSFDEGSAAWNPDAVEAAIEVMSDKEAGEMVAAAMEALNGGAVSAERGAHVLAALARRTPSARPNQAQLVSRVTELLDPGTPPAEVLARALGAASSWVDLQLFREQLKALRKTKDDLARMAASSFESGHNQPQ